MIDNDSFYRGLILVAPYGSYVVQNKKSTLIKSIKLHNISHKPLLLIQDKKALGIIYLSDPERINLTQFKDRYNQHHITDDDRIKWWGHKKRLYQYTIIKTKKHIYHTPIDINYHPGPQVLIRPNNLWQVIKKQMMIGTSGYQNNSTLDDKINYMTKLNSVEINYTYYRIPSDDTWTRWFNETPSTFTFSIKLNRHLIYYQNTKKYRNMLKDFMKGARLLGNKLKVLLIQFNKRYRFNTDNKIQLSHLLDMIAKYTKYTKSTKSTKSIKHNSIDVAVEFRDRSWFDTEIYNLLKEKKVGLVITNINNKNDWTNLDNGYNPPLNTFVKTTNFVYIRLHGTKGQYVGKYNTKQLKEIISFIEPLKIKKAYVYFNNTDSDDAFNDALKLTTLTSTI